jgi:predicted O-linked N-acetylglucosamine transferase (SPINDLY family)
VNPPLVAQWAKLLKAVPGSRLVIKAAGLGRGEAVRRFEGLFAAQGIGPKRYDLLPRSVTTAQHLETYNRIDVALDTFPFHGTTTTCEALWMGVPVVTCAGQSHWSRVGASLLASAGLGDLVAENLEDYVAIATELAGDVERRRDLRLNLRDQLRRSVLMDAPRAARCFESAMREIWRQRVNLPS